jgi:hypothetical protein
LDRAVAISARPRERMSSVARRSAMSTGWFHWSITEHIVRMRILLVWAAMAA